MRRIYLIDCPGIVPPSLTDTATDILLRGVVRVENVENPEQYISAVLQRCKHQHIERTYEIQGWKDSTTFLEQLARKGGRLLKGGEADLDGVAKMVLNDFIRGKLPWFTPVPKGESAEGEEEAMEGREGRLGEMRKRKAEDEVEEEKGEGEEEATAGEDGEEEWDGIQDDDEEENSGNKSESGSTDGAPTLVADDSNDEKVEDAEPVKAPFNPRKRRKEN